MHMHKTIVWWSLWGLAVGIGLFGLQEVHRNSLHLILATPLLTGAMAAAVLRLKHEYHEALVHAKWVVVSGGLLLMSTGYAYVKTENFGPFATGSTHRAFLNTTFEMSVPEVERALGRKFQGASADIQGLDGLKVWLMDIMPRVDPASTSRTLSDLVVYQVPCRARFDFTHGRLAQVTVEFDPTRKSESGALLQHLQSDLEKEYKSAEVPAGNPAGSLSYTKDAVIARLIPKEIDEHRRQWTIFIQYMPLAEPVRAPLRIENQAF
jgi:hypothetical protein